MNTNCRNNNIAAIGEDVTTGIWGLAGVELEVCLQNNRITTVGVGSFRKFYGETLVFRLNNNLIGTGSNLPDGLFSTFFGESLVVDLTNNSLHSAHAIFKNFTSGPLVSVELANNHLATDDLYRILNSFNQSSANLYIGLRENNITFLGDYLFEGIGTLTQDAAYNTVELDLSVNPITAVSHALFQGHSFLQNVTINMSFPTAGRIDFPQNFSFTNGSFIESGSELNLYLAATGAPYTVFAGLDGFPPATASGIPCDAVVLKLDMR